MDELGAGYSLGRRVTTLHEALPPRDTSATLRQGRQGQVVAIMFCTPDMQLFVG